MGKKIYTLCIVHTDTHVLLGMKKRGLGEGFWNGFGGKVEEGEKIEAAARRELLEESGIQSVRLEKRGVNSFEFVGDPTILEVHVFDVQEFEGTPTESEEMKPQWFKKTDIPYSVMWADDKFWLPHFFAGQRFAGAFTFKDKAIVKHRLNIFEA